MFVENDDRGYDVPASVISLGCDSYVFFAVEIGIIWYILHACHHLKVYLIAMSVVVIPLVFGKEPDLTHSCFI